MSLDSKWLVFFLALAFTCACSSTSTQNGNSADDDTPPPVNTGLSGKIQLQIQSSNIRAYNLSEEQRELDWNAGEIIFIPKEGTSVDTLLNEIKKIDDDLTLLDQEAPYFRIRSDFFRESRSEIVSQKREDIFEQEAPDDDVLDTEERLHQLLDRLQHTSNLFEHVAPNYFRTKQQQFEGPYNEYQWALNRYDMMNVWTTFGHGSRNIAVAVIDSGVWMTHPNLKYGLRDDGFDFVSDAERSGDGDGIDHDPNTPIDAGSSSEFHGTHVAGIIGAYSDPEGTIGSSDLVVQIDGMASGLSILPLRALARSGGTDFDIAQAILYAAGLASVGGPELDEPRAQVINLSLGGAEANPILEDAIEHATARGVIVVAAAGNESTASPTYPAAYPQVISVGALSTQNDYVSYSNTGPNVDLMAPGGGDPPWKDGSDFDDTPDGILSTWVEPTLFGTPSYKHLSGTSMAAPHIAALVGLMLSVNPELKLPDIRQILFETASLDYLPDCDEEKCGHGGIAIKEVLEKANHAVPSQAKIELEEDWIAISDSTTTRSILLKNVGASPLHSLPNEPIHITSNAEQEWLHAKAITQAEGVLIELEANPSLLNGVPTRARLDILSNASEIWVRDRHGNRDVSHNGVVHLHVYYEPKDVVYVALIDAQSKNIADWEMTSASKDFAYHLEPEADGEYIIYAGTVLDVDDRVCGKNKQCGAYPHLASPEKIHFTKGDLVEGLNFSLETTTNDDHELVLPLAQQGTGVTP